MYVKLFQFLATTKRSCVNFLNFVCAQINHLELAWQSKFNAFDFVSGQVEVLIIMSNMIESYTGGNL